MNFSELTSKKTQARDSYKSTYSFPRRSKILIWVHFTDSNLTKEILSWFAVLPANFIVFWKDLEKFESKNIGFCDSHEDFDMIWIDALLCNCNDVKI